MKKEHEAPKKADVAGTIGREDLTAILASVSKLEEDIEEAFQALIRQHPYLVAGNDERDEKNRI